MTMPTNCGKRPECQGCGALCFPQHSPDDPYFSDMLDYTGFSAQTNSPFDGTFPPGTANPPSPPTCAIATHTSCYKGGQYVKRFGNTDSESASNANCCAACGAMPTALSWMMITRAGQTSPQCWCMSTLDFKSSSDLCVGAPLQEPGVGSTSPLRSGDIVLQWWQVEAEEGVYDWGDLITGIKNARGSDPPGVLMVLLWTGVWGPNWMFAKNTTAGRAAVPVLAHSPHVATKGDCPSAKGIECAPTFTDATYQMLLRRVHAELASTLREMNALGNVVIALQPCLGSTGDDTPIHLTGPDGDWIVDNQHGLKEMGCTTTSCGGIEEGAWWFNFTRSFTSSLVSDDDLFGQEAGNGKFRILLNTADAPASFTYEIATTQFPGSYIKLGQVGHQYQSNDERTRAAGSAPYVYELPPMRSRAELSGETCWTKGDYYNPTKCPTKPNWLAMARFVAANHLDFWNVQPGTVSEADATDNIAIWNFLNRYSGLRWPEQSTGCWIAFRDGIDAMDTERFDTATYGDIALNKAGGYGLASNAQRAKNICTALAAQGCKIDSESTLIGGALKQRRQDGMNDIGFNFWRTDYANFITQIEPLQTRGWWRIAMDETSYFGRFARGWLDPTDSSATMALRIDPGMWGGLPLSANRAASIGLTLRLIFLDQGTGQFSVHYDSNEDAAQTIVVAKKGSGEWRELCVSLIAPRFSGSDGGDVWLTNDDTEDDIWDSLEISTASSEEIALKGCDWQN